jgi:hypothetical protein
VRRERLLRAAAMGAIRACDVCSVGDVQVDRDDAPITLRTNSGEVRFLARSCVHFRGAPFEKGVNERRADSSVGAGHQCNGVLNLHASSLLHPCVVLHLSLPNEPNSCLSG